MTTAARRPDPALARKTLEAALNHLRRGELGSGERLLAEVLRDFPRDPTAMHLMGTIWLQRNRIDEAIRLIRGSLAIAPRNPGAHSDLGLALWHKKELDEATHHLKRAIELKPDFVEAWVNLGNIERDRDRPLEAESAYRKALELRPEAPVALNNLALVLNTLGRPREAEDAARRAVAARPQFAEAYQTLAVVLDNLGRYEESVEAHQQAIALMPRNPKMHADLGKTQMAYGRREAAAESYRRAVELEPANADWQRALVWAEGGDGEPLSALEARFNAPALDSTGRIHLAFAIGRRWEASGEYDRAMFYLEEANRLQRAAFDYDPVRTERRFADVRETYTSELFAAHAKAGAHDPAPIFILGMPRSGTTLVEQILVSHSEVHAGGELTFLRDVAAAELGEGTHAEMMARMSDAGLTAMGETYLGRLHGLDPKARFITDKMPGNFVLIGLIRLALPDARIIHCVRDPADTCVSIYKNYFSQTIGYANDLGELGHYYRQYQQLMAHWHEVLPGVIYDVSYETLVADQEGETRKLLAHCGLKFEPQVLEFHKTERPVYTASAGQVHQPIYDRSIGIAARYGELLRPLHDALAGGPVVSQNTL